jgi:hypothetical protein
MLSHINVGLYEDLIELRRPKEVPLNETEVLKKMLKEMLEEMPEEISEVMPEEKPITTRQHNVSNLRRGENEEQILCERDDLSY